jgi:membrane associated rhomboid family serine protease
VITKHGLWFPLLFMGALNPCWQKISRGLGWRKGRKIQKGHLRTLQKIVTQTALMFITYAFLHGGFMHLALNSVILLSLGKFVSIHIGAAKTVLVLFLSAVGGAACFGIISSSSAPMIGASGAVFGLIGLWQAMDYRMRRRSKLPVRPVVMAFLGLVASNILIFVLLSGGLAWEAHLGGWIVGWISGQSFARR